MFRHRMWVPRGRQDRDRALARDRWAPGVTVLSTAGHDQLPEIRCQCDGGRHGSPRITTHAYGVAFTVEIRYGGVDILVDPGTYCSAGDSPWPSYLWFRRAHAGESEVLDHGDVAKWAAEHDACLWLDSPVRHRRSVLLDRASRIVDIVDQVDGSIRDICTALYLGPEIQVELGQFSAFLSWPSSVTPGAARLELSAGFSWSLHQADTAWTLLGRGGSVAGAPLATRLEFDDTEMPQKAVFFQAVPWSASGNCREKEQDKQAEAR